MFAEVKDTLPISGDDYDGWIIREIKAAARDLTTSAEIELPGEIVISMNPDTGTVTDESTLTDELIITAIATWCNMRIGNPPNYDKLLAAYNSLKGQLRLSKTYTASEVTTE
jgi:hypothetical protein